MEPQLTQADPRLSWTPALEKVGRLTPREHEVFLLLADGLGNTVIGRRLFITERTVRAHAVSILSKLELPSRMQVCLTAAAYAQGVGKCDGYCRERQLASGQ
ncbi:response regulator transcription factor [Streptomyces sioyaensis]|uniref:response regulator transcription factor n=1 Tax=Streptomyces sioyaensis TaxID=67364 RepID=UPI00365F8C80